MNDSTAFDNELSGTIGDVDNSTSPETGGGIDKSKVAESSNTGPYARREAPDERCAQPPLDSPLVTETISNQCVFTEITTPVTPHQWPIRQTVFKWKEDWDFKYGPWGSPEGWRREKQHRSDHEAKRQQRQVERDASGATWTSMDPLDAVHVEIHSDWPLAERHDRCLQRYAAVGRCENAHDTPIAVPCRDAWCPRCRSQALFRFESIYRPDSRIHDEHEATQARKFVGPTATIITITRSIGPTKLVTKEPERFAQVRRAVGKAVERLAKREVTLMRADRLRVDESGMWHIDRHVLLQGTPNLGRLQGADIVGSGDATNVAQQFLDLAGSTWFDDPVEETVARVLVTALSRRHRVEVFGQFKKLLRATDTERQCAKCGALIEIDFLPTFAAPLVPLTLSEFEKVLTRMQRGPPMIVHRASRRVA